MNANDKLEKIAERVYNASFVITVLLIVAASIGTAIARYTLDSKIELVPDNVFKFIERILWIFALPVSIKIIGDKLPLIVQAIVAVRGNGYGQMGAYPGSPSSQFYTGSGTYQNNPFSQGETGGGANPNTYY
jgi:hypothetical protein